MGHESIVYGCIVGARWKVTDYRRLQRLNRTEIATLPENDEWPFLTRSMFAIPGDNFQEGTYRSQLIHFGATFKAIEWEWGQWLVKFEELLIRLFWDEVSLHLRTELVGNHDYHYLPTKEHRESFYKCEPPPPTTSWVLTGGPRRFLDTGPEFDDDEEQTWLYANGIWSLKPRGDEQPGGDET